MQVQRELDWLYAETGARVATCVGGMDARARAAARSRHGAHIVVGTPGRLRDHLERGAPRHLARCAPSCSTKPTRCSTWASARTSSSSSTPTPAERRTLLFSATIAREIATLAKRYQRDALRIATIAPRRGRTATSSIARSASRRNERRARRRQPAALLRGARRASCSAPRATRVRHLHAQPARARLLRRGALGRAQPGASAPTRCRRCATAAPASASPPTSPPAASTCPTSASSSTPTCRTTPRRLLHRSGRTGRAGRQGHLRAHRAVYPPPQGRGC